MSNTTTMTKASTTRTPDALKPRTVYPLMSSDMQLEVDTTAACLPDDERDVRLACHSLRGLIFCILKGVKEPLSREQCRDVADLVVGSIQERAKVQRSDGF